MKILAFESSAKAAGVALLEDGVLLAESFQNTALTHSRTLMQMAEDMLRNCELSANDVDAVAVAAGPGSFTGVRIGVAAAFRRLRRWFSVRQCAMACTAPAWTQDVSNFIMQSLLCRTENLSV